MKPECRRYADAILDDELPRPPDFSSHVIGCSDCAALREGDEAALALKGLSLSRAERMPAGKIAIRLGVVVGLAVAAVSVGLWQRRPPEPVLAIVSVPPREQPVLQVVRSEEPAEDDGFALAQLSLTVHRYARVNPVAHGYGHQWRSLPMLLAPRTSQPLAILEHTPHPLITSSEE
jgi:hypothetical protein